MAAHAKHAGSSLAGPAALLRVLQGDHVARLGASHQTDWTGLAEDVIDEWRQARETKTAKTIERGHEAI